jgi:hypothetical protein
VKEYKKSKGSKDVKESMGLKESKDVMEYKKSKGSKDVKESMNVK